MKQKEKLMQLKVAGVENVTVPAGTFEAWKIDLTPATATAGLGDLDRARLAQVLKSTAVIVEMGGATQTTELTQ